MNQEIQDRALCTLERFSLNGKVVSARPFGQGHINDTFLVTVAQSGRVEPEYVLQHINKRVFPNVEILMHNIIQVTQYLQKKLDSMDAGCTKTLTLVPTRSGELYYKDEEGEYWRVYLYVKNTCSYNLPQKPGMFYDAAVAHGKFVEMLAGFPANLLHETLPGFHDTEARLQQLLDTAKRDPRDRSREVAREMDFVLAHAGEIPQFNRMQERGELPVRVTHNDTKLNNVLFDIDTDESVCVIDLDTVMPGLLAYDFGDAIRFGASTAAEDETDLEKCHIDLSRFEEYTAGFLCGCGGTMTKNEILTLPQASKIMTLECGIRFLADYLNGDIYFKIHSPNHNLDRARNQFKLVADMEENWDEMNRIIRRVASDV